MSYLKSLYSLRSFIKPIYCPIFISNKSLCDKRVDLNIKIEVDKSENENTKSNTLLFGDEEVELDMVTEREKDASIRGKLSKEYNKMLTGNKIQVMRISDGNKLLVKDTSLELPEPVICPAESPIISKVKEKVDSSQPPSRDPPEFRINPGKVILGFIPKEWSDAFIPITGVTGFGTFLFTTWTYLVSKEYYVLEHNFYEGISCFICVYGVVKYIGPSVAEYLDKEIDAYNDSWEKFKQDTIDELNQDVAHEIHLQYQADGQLMLVEAKRENVALQLENEFRKRQLRVHDEVKCLLDYQVAVANIKRRFQQKNLVDYVYEEVLKACSEDLQMQLINASIDTLVVELNKVKLDVGPAQSECK